jgi:hypothetical protein
MTKKGVSKSKAEASISRPPFSLCELTSRSRPSFCESFEGVAKLLHGRNNIVVLVGAGISVSCGIPDFRTKGKLRKITGTSTYRCDQGWKPLLRQKKYEMLVGEDMK